VVFQILGQENRSHPAAAELALDRVCARQGSLQLRAKLDHRSSQGGEESSVGRFGPRPPAIALPGGQGRLRNALRYPVAGPCAMVFHGWDVLVFPDNGARHTTARRSGALREGGR